MGADAFLSNGGGLCEENAYGDGFFYKRTKNMMISRPYRTFELHLNVNVIIVERLRF